MRAVDQRVTEASVPRTNLDRYAASHSFSTLRSFCILAIIGLPCPWSYSWCCEIGPAKSVVFSHLKNDLSTIPSPSMTQLGCQPRSVRCQKKSFTKTAM